MSARRHALARPREKGWLRSCWLASYLTLLLLLLAGPARAEPDYPAFSGRVVDAAHVLSDADREALTTKLAGLQNGTKVQFAVATVPSLGGLEIEPYANALFRKWGVGQKGSSNGLLLLLAPNERKVRFEVGYGLEGTMTDAQAKLILRNDMVPKLKAGDPAGALKAGVDDAIAVLTNKDAALPKGSSQPDSSGEDALASAFVYFFIYGIPLMIAVIWIIVLIRAVRGIGRWATGKGGTSSSWSDSSSSSSFGGSSSSSDSSSSGSSDSFSGGGGGDSGGGGASDSY